MTKLFDRTHVQTRASNYIGTFRNTKRAHKVVAGLSVMLSKWGTIYKQGRNPNRKGLVTKTGKCHSDLRRGVPIPHSTHFDVYLNRRNFPYDRNQMEGIPAVHLSLLEMLND
jgi:hypothetical protein